MTLDQLEGIEWGPPEADTYLVRTCHRLRKVPIGEFGVEDLRIMIGQSIGLFFLVPVALDVLARDPLAEGDLYPGDLLSSVLRSDPGFWNARADLRSQVDQILARMPEIPDELAEAVVHWSRCTA
jgi:hypothetical protein